MKHLKLYPDNTQRPNHALQRTDPAGHGTCFRRHLAAHHAGAAPAPPVAELGVVRPLAHHEFGSD